VSAKRKQTETHDYRVDEYSFGNAAKRKQTETHDYRVDEYSFGNAALCRDERETIVMNSSYKRRSAQQCQTATAEYASTPICMETFRSLKQLRRVSQPGDECRRIRRCLPSVICGSLVRLVGTQSTGVLQRNSTRGQSTDLVVIT